MTNKTDSWHMFVWKIDNFSYCWHKKAECISSPIFHMERAQWRLQIFPRGSEKSGSYISCFLKSESSSKCEIQFQLSFIDLNGSSLAKWTSKDRTVFTRNTTEGKEYFAYQNDVFAKDRMKFLPNDTLTVICNIKNTGLYTGVLKIFARTSIEVCCETIKEEISGFSTFYDAHITVPPASYGKPIKSIKFSASEGICCDKNMFIEIFFKIDEQMKFSTCSVFLLDTAGSKLKCGKSDIWFQPDKTYQTCTIPLIFTKWELMAKKDLYLPSDTLSLLFEFSTSMGILKEIIEKFDSVVNTISYAYSAENDDGESNVLDDLGNLFKENILCDVYLQTSTKTFSSHKAILGARSPVFKAMFTNDLKEKTTNQVDIEDLDDETIHRLLLYIYTNTVENLQWQTASQLYIAADKYCIGSLKKICSSIIEINLCRTNLGEILELADRHQDAHLKNCVEDYILRYDKSVIGSDEWKDLELKNSRLTSETICNVYRKRF